RDRLLKQHGELEQRVLATGAASPDEAVNYLAASDLLLQPYGDGVSSRRTSLMAGLALGLPIVTTDGPLSEPLWHEHGAVALAPAGDDDAIVAATVVLLQETVRKRLGEKAHLFYQRNFSVEQLIRKLRSG